MKQEKELEITEKLMNKYSYYEPLKYDLFRSLNYIGNARATAVIPEEVSYLTGFKNWYVGFPNRYSKFHDVVCSEFEECLVVELPFYMLFNYDVWKGLIDKYFLIDLVNFYLEAEKHVPDHISIWDKIYVVHEVYHKNFDEQDTVRVEHDIHPSMILIVFHHFEHCSIKDLRVLFDLVEYWLGDYADWSLQEFSCNAEGIVLMGYTDDEDNPVKNLVKHYIASHIVKYGFKTVYG